MNFRRIFLLLSVLYVSFFYGQAGNIEFKTLNQYPADKIKTDEYGNRYYYDEANKAKIYEINGETVVVLDELIISAKPHFNNQLDRNYYFFLNKKLNRVYPLFLTALDQYQTLHEQLAAMTPSERRQVAKARQQVLANEYETKLRDLTTTEGQVFAKLMSRATGKTVYEIIKELRGGWSAFWWNIKGNIAEIDLKEPYDPHKNRTDAFLESLLQSSWNLGLLKPYEGAQNFKVEDD